MGPLNRGSEIEESKQILTTKSDKMQKAIYILSALKLSEAAAVEHHLEAAAPEDEQALVQTEATTLAQTEDDEPSQLDTVNELAQVENVDWTPHGDLKDLAGMSGIVLRDLPAVKMPMKFGESKSRVNKTYNREKGCRVCSRGGYGVFGGQQKSRYGRGRLSGTRSSRYGRPTSSRTTKSRWGRQTSTRPSRQDSRLSRDEQEHPILRYPQKPSSRRSKSIQEPIRTKTRPA